jgi:hypothetical protein
MNSIESSKYRKTLEATESAHPDTEIAAIFRKCKWDLVHWMILLFIAQAEITILAFFICLPR